MDRAGDARLLQEPRPPRAARDSTEAIDYVVAHARTRADQEACVAALVTKCEILWAMVEAIAQAHGSGPAVPFPGRDA